MRIAEATGIGTITVAVKLFVAVVPLRVELVAPPTKYTDTVTAPSAREDASIPVTVKEVAVLDPELTAELPVTLLPFVSVRDAVTVPVSADPPLGKVTATETALLDALLMEFAEFVPEVALTAAPVGATAATLKELLTFVAAPEVATNVNPVPDLSSLQPAKLAPELVVIAGLAVHETVAPDVPPLRDNVTESPTRSFPKRS